MPRNAILKHLVPINDGQHVLRGRTGYWEGEHMENYHMKLECKDHIEVDADAAARGELPSSSCCARRRVANEPDFLAQREWLREVVEDKGHCVLYFRKFHCEFLGNILKSLFSMLAHLGPSKSIASTVLISSSNYTLFKLMHCLMQ